MVKNWWLLLAGWTEAVLLITYPKPEVTVILRKSKEHAQIIFIFLLWNFAT